MLALISTFILITLLTINHIIYGQGCWGFQPGGKYSGLLYMLQLVVFLVIFFKLSITHKIGEKRPCKISVYIVLASCLSVVIVSYMFIGWKINTSIHHMGVENLIPFLCASMTSILLGGIDVSARKLKKS